MRKFFHAINIGSANILLLIFYFSVVGITSLLIKIWKSIKKTEEYKTYWEKSSYRIDIKSPY